MSLDEKLAALREASAGKMPAEVKEVLVGAVKDLRANAMDRIIKVGDALPSFTLQNQDGVDVSSAALLANGPVVLSIYRGHW
jgi:hypothetical protein